MPKQELTIKRKIACGLLTIVQFFALYYSFSKIGSNGLDFLGPFLFTTPVSIFSSILAYKSLTTKKVHLISILLLNSSLLSILAASVALFSGFK
jgi:hypothetical protein